MTRWGRSPAGDALHRIVAGASLCGVQVVEEPGAQPDHEFRCRNCDRRWREAGRVNRPKARRKRDVTVYRPRWRFEDAES